MSVSLQVAELGDKPTLANLMELYIHDFSSFEGFQVDDDGRFGYRYLDAYWSDDGRVPYLFRSDGKLAGFGLVRRRSDGTHEIAEFFVLRNHRRAGLGRAAARALIATRAGAWSVDVHHTNPPALAFWTSVLQPYGPARSRWESEGIERSTFRFTTEGSVSR